MVNFGLYTRKSSDDRLINEKSIAEQLNECRQVAVREMLFVLSEIEENKSAKVPGKRPLYLGLIDLVERGEINGILCWHVNRLVRNMEEGGKLAQLLIDGQIKEIRTPHATYRSGDNIMPLVIEAASATQYSIDLARVVSRGSDAAFRAGGCMNRVVQGYRNGRNPDNLKQGIVTRDDDRFEIVKQALRLFLTGHYSPQKVLRAMNDTWGFTTRPSRKRGGKPLSQSAIYTLLGNPFYAGLVRRKGELVKGNHEAMITVEEYERIQRLLKVYSFSAPRVREYSYTGLMHCVYCGSQITAEVKRLSHGALWENYRCSDSRRTCTKMGMALGNVRKKLVIEAASLKIDQDALELATDEILRALDLSAQSESTEKSQQAALKQTVQRQKRLEDMWLDGLISDAARYKSMEQEILERKNELTVALSRSRSLRQRMLQNLDRAKQHLKQVADEFEKESPLWHKEFFKSLAVDYKFDGRKKVIRIEIAPILEELVSFARQLNPLEPPKSSSYEPKEMPRTGALLYGGQDSSPVELVPSLVTALLETKLPEWNLVEEPRDELSQMKSLQA